VSATAVVPLPGTATRAAGGPLGRDAARHRREGGAGSGRAHRARGGCAAGAGEAARGPAPSRESGRFFRAAVPATGLLCAFPDSAGGAAAAVLFVPVPSGFASCGRPRGTLALAAAAPTSPAAFTSTTTSMTSLRIARRFCLTYCSRAKKEEGAGGSGSPRPPLLSSSVGAGGMRHALGCG
jgi:hypothetical protein